MSSVEFFICDKQGFDYLPVISKKGYNIEQRYQQTYSYLAFHSVFPIQCVLVRYAYSDSMEGKQQDG